MKHAHYPVMPSSPDFAELEKNILAGWEAQRTFEQSVAMRPAQDANGNNNEYVFYDGPPFANGLPHHGHLLTGFVKDLFARYHTMKGQKVERRFGWDCHGLPAEMGAEKELNISGRRAIMEYGIANFNDYCRSSVMQYADQWRYYVNRQARWVDFDNDYKTMDTNYMESVIWAFSELYKKGYIYENFKVMPYSWSAETVLSSSEIRLDDATRPKEDKAVEVAFKLKERPAAIPNDKDVYLVAWTTTPWTLPSNLALAVSPLLTYYANFNQERDRWEITNRVLGHAVQEGQEQAIDQASPTISGTDLIGLSYEPLFPYFAGHLNAFRVLAGDFIEEGSGTGVVHMAPGFGEDDQRVCAENGIDVVVPVDGEGRYSSAIYDLPNITLHEDGSLETARCILRAPTSEDEAHFIALHTNAQVMETVNDGPMSEEEAKADFARNLAHFAEHGYGQWAVIEKTSGAFMGRAGLSFVAQSEEMPAKPTLRCGLLPHYWHGGYGRELCHASLWYGFMNQGFEDIAGGAVPHNPRAHVMMKSLGMRYIKDVMFKRMVGPYFHMTREEFLALNQPLSLRGLNVIKETKGKREDEPYSDAQLEKYGLANLRIINWLKSRGRLIKQEDYTHNYPHCWRTDQPIIYRAVSSWFVDVPQFRDRMVELNQEINWIPGHIKDGRFGKWIENAREWSISRSRFWGCPIPVWRSDNPNNDELYVFGSIAELEEFFGQPVSDLHRPYIDELTKPDPQNPAYTIRRVEEVFDCWFESGSMPYAQMHYPFENKDWFETHFPADFIVEYEAQTRGWFYNMFVLAVALFDRIPFKNCICHGVVLDDSGRKLSKRLKNYMDPRELFETFGSDALRWFMMSSTIMRGSELLLDPKGQFIHDAIRLYIKPLWNAYNFFTLYANADGVKANLITAEAMQGADINLFDRYILAKCRQMVDAVEAALDAYDTPVATQAITDFIEVLNNWYIRRNKERFWTMQADADKQAAYDTLYTVLHITCRTAAPLLPMISEAIYGGLTNGESVHLADWPDVSAIAPATDITDAMDRVRDVCNTALSIRNGTKIRVRQPLRALTIYSKTLIQQGDVLDAIIQDELNVHQVIWNGEIEAVANYTLKLNNPLIGKRLPEKMKQVIPAAKKGDWEQTADGLMVSGIMLHPEEYELKLEPKAGVDGAAAISTNDALVVLDLTITPELEAEGLARDLVRMIQAARKDADLDIAARIELSLSLPQAVEQAARFHQDYIAEQTLARVIAFTPISGALHISKGELGGAAVEIAISLSDDEAAA